MFETRPALDRRNNLNGLAMVIRPRAWTLHRAKTMLLLVTESFRGLGSTAAASLPLQT
jgi:hypothetical protein